MKNVFRLLLLIVLIVMVSGCGNKEDKFEVFFFSDIPSSFAEGIENVIKEAVSVEEEFELFMFPVTYERLVVEIAAHNGDIFFLKEELMSAAYAPEGLVPLEKAVSEELFENTNEYKDVNSETGETHLYAVRIDNSSPLLKGIELQDPLVAIVPVYSDKEALSLELLQYIMKHS
ncbi:hypothetical protein ACFFHM_23045 [Halalkalibacter kiskunsagensis]|uniref:Lipoprotein n=1 Tax=Halalkalibacter kiskunsagensis TaxID=1548599 RepID=A0ABV6KIZ4_9BACI